MAVWIVAFLAACVVVCLFCCWGGASDDAKAAEKKVRRLRQEVADLEAKLDVAAAERKRLADEGTHVGHLLAESRAKYEAEVAAHRRTKITAQKLADNIGLIEHTVRAAKVACEEVQREGAPLAGTSKPPTDVVPKGVNQWPSMKPSE